MRILVGLLSVLCVFVLGANLSPVLADCVTLRVDSAPNVYGSSDWAGWWTQAKIDVVADKFTDMRTGTYTGTLTIDPYDEIVYSTGDLGKRLHWIYWVPNATTTSLAGNFEVKWVIDWGGEAWTWVNGAWAQDGAEIGWSQPSTDKWENYESGVIGSLGFAWWSVDNDALPLNTGGNAYDEVDEADIDALRDQVFQYQTFATGYVRIRESANDEWCTTELTVTIVPLPLASLAGLGMLGGLALVRRWRRRG